MNTKQIAFVESPETAEVKYYFKLWMRTKAFSFLGAGTFHLLTNGVFRPRLPNRKILDVDEFCCLGL